MAGQGQADLERPLRHAGSDALCHHAPDGANFGVRVPDLEAEEALLAPPGDGIFATPHFDGYPGVLVQLDHIAMGELEELIVEAWVTQSPKRLVRQRQENR